MNPHVHLSDEQIDEYLIGGLADEQQAHLQICGSCQARVAEIEAPIASFKAVSLAWSERKSATLPLHPAGEAKSPWTRRAVWAATVTAALVIGIAVPLAHRYQDTQAPAVAQAGTPDNATVTSAAPVVADAGASHTREEQIAQDNRMLQAINSELASAPEDVFGLNQVSSPASERRHHAQVRD